MMSIASSPPAPTMAQFTFATTDPSSATDSQPVVDDPATQQWRTNSLASSRAPPRALSPRVYGRSPRLPSALPLSASPGFVEPCTPDGQAQHMLSLFAPDDAMESAPLLDNIDPLSERERERRVASRIQWTAAQQGRAPTPKVEDDVVDENVAADLFSQMPRKYSGSMAPPLPAMSVPEFLPSPEAPQSAQRHTSMAMPTTTNDAKSNMMNLDTNAPNSNNNLTSWGRNANNVGMASFSMPNNSSVSDIGLPSSTMQPGSFANGRRDVPTLQIPNMELAPLRAQPAAEPMPWEPSFGRSPGLGRSPGPLVSAFNSITKEEPKTDMTMDLPNLSLPNLPTQMDRMDITMHPTQKPRASSIAMVLGSSSSISEPDNANANGTGRATRKRRSSSRCQDIWDDSAPPKPRSKKPPTQPLPPNSDVDPLCCTICGTKFARRSNLYKHLRSVHEEVRKFSCDLCTLKFKRQDHLIKHKRSVHAKVRKYSCEICGIGFAEKFNRDKHSRNIHSIKRAFQCPCGAYFQDKDKMQNCLKCKQMTAF